ncbi:hypothetical protein, partial [Acutalibacter muris]|uniref:hypothetical protein n=1 Tax=Acutalibacter muris TaxID=1796620 RepID=UPI00272ADA21
AAKALGIIVATISMANSAASDLFRNLLLFMISTLLILDSRPALFCRRVEVIYILLPGQTVDKIAGRGYTIS